MECLESVILGDAWKSVELCADATAEQRAIVTSVHEIKQCEKGRESEEDKVSMFCENMPSISAQ